MQTSEGANEVVVKLVPGGDAGLAHLSDRELLAGTRELVGRSNQVFAALLAHLAEVDARGLHRTRACASLYTYCIYELRFSEDAAARRAGAAKLVKRFPILLRAIADGELHLTGLLMLGPHFTAENVVEVLERAKFRTKKELAKLVRELHPLPLVPDLVEALRPAPRPLRRPTCEEYAASLAPAVRELPLGERPKDWANDVDDVNVDANHTGMGSRLFAGGMRDTRNAAEECLGDGSASESSTLAALRSPTGVDVLFAVSPESIPPAPARVEPLWAELPPITGPQQYQVQFSTSEEHVQLIERAKALLARTAPGKSLGELHLEAMRLLVASLEKQKFATTAHPRAAVREPSQPSVRRRTTASALTAATSARGHKPKDDSPALARSTEPGANAGEDDSPALARSTEPDANAGEDDSPALARSTEPGANAGEDNSPALARSTEPDAGADADADADAPAMQANERPKSRYIPAAVRRAVYERDASRCTFVDERGQRCQETHYLELHHRRPFGKQGAHTVANLTLHCRAHNALAAELDFGREHMADRQNPERHESIASERRAARQTTGEPD